MNSENTDQDISAIKNSSPSTTDEVFYTQDELKKALEGAEQFKQFYQSCDEAERKFLLVEFDGREGLELISMFIGLKPASTVNSMAHLYKRIADMFPRFVKGNMVIFDRAQVLRVIEKHEVEFSDFNKETAQSAISFGAIANVGEAYIDGYVSSTINSDREKDNKRKGYLLGYPDAAVESYGLPGEVDAFDRFGLSFTYKKNDKLQIEKFSRKVGGLFAETGMDVFVKDQSKVLRG